MTRYSVTGTGPPLVFLHGWGLGHRSYRGAITAAARLGHRVYAPSLPGFGGTPPLARPSLDAYAAWVDAFLDEAGVVGPVTLVGHSFGGGVAIRTAHDAPSRVERLVLVNSVGGALWQHRPGAIRTMRERPIWDWGLRLPAELHLHRIVPAIAVDALENLRHPGALWRVGRLAAMTDLTAELSALRVPTAVVWAREDAVLPWACLESLRSALREPPTVLVDGNHGWLITAPDLFVGALADALEALALPEAA